MNIRRNLIFATITVLLITACVSANESIDAGSVASQSQDGKVTVADETVNSSASTEVDLTNLPLGDDNISTSPQVGFLYSCQTTFGGGGAFNDGEWIKTDGSYDLTAKAIVDGSVEWDGEYSISIEGEQRVIEGNQLPNHPTGNYPIAASDDAYDYDRNPNSISAQDFSLSLPANPEVADQAACISMGTIGFMLTGSVFFNAVDALGRDAVAHEIQDACGGHPERSGAYHYHSLTPCIDGDGGDGHIPDLLGYALDGFGIYGYSGENGETMTNADLDACHGHTHQIEWDGALVAMFHYHATWEYPYTIGCYRGSPVSTPGGGGGPPNGGGRPALTGFLTPDDETAIVL